MTWAPLIRNPIDLPLLQMEMFKSIEKSYDFDNNKSIQATDLFGEMYLTMIDAYIGGAEGGRYVEMVGSDIADAMENGAAYFVADEMTTMLHRVAKNVPEDFSLHPRMFPQNKGFLYLEEPLIFGDSAVIGWSWHVIWLTTESLLSDAARDPDFEEKVLLNGGGFEDVLIRLMDEGLVVRGKGKNEEIAGVALALWSDPLHDDDLYYLDKRLVTNGSFGLGQFDRTPAPMAFTWIPCGVPLKDHIYGSIPYRYRGQPMLDPKKPKSYGRIIDFASSIQAAPVWSFLVATHEMLNSRIVEQRGLNRAQQRQLHRVRWDREFKIVRLRKIVRVNGHDADDDGKYKIDYRYMVPPHWQRYHTKEGVVWKMRDWYVAGPDDKPVLDREVVYQLDR
jgi:hypothetical protein